MSGNKGISFTLEAIISGLLIITSILFFFQFSGTSDFYSMGVSEIGYDCMKSLDEHGLMREHALNGDAASIESGLQECLGGLNHSVQLCENTCSQATSPENNTVIVSSYFIAGDVEPNPMEIRLNMWLYE